MASDEATSDQVTVSSLEIPGAASAPEPILNGDALGLWEHIEEARSEIDQRIEELAGRIAGLERELRALTEVITFWHTRLQRVRHPLSGRHTR